MAIGPGAWSSLGEYTLVDLAVNASIRGEFWFGKSNKALLTKFAETLNTLTGESITYECVMKKLNDLYHRYKTWLWVCKQDGLSVEVETMRLLGSQEVWDKIIKENSSAARYRFKHEKFSIALDIIFGYPLLRATTEQVQHVNDENGQQAGNQNEVIDVSDDDSNMMEAQWNAETNIMLT